MRIPDDCGVIICESSDQNETLNAARIAAVNELNAQIPNSAAYFNTDNMIGTFWGNNNSGVPFSTGWGYHFNARAENYLEVGWRAGTAALTTGMASDDLVTTQVNLTGVFSDAEDPTLTYTVTANTNTALVSTSITGSALKLTYTHNMTGQAVITVRATDSGGLYVEDSFIARALPINSAPIVANPLADQVADEDAGDVTISLSNTFYDEIDTVLTLTVSGNTNTSLVTANINGTNLILHYAANASGSANITVRGTDSDSLYAEDTFAVTVHPVNDAPTLAGSIADVTVDEDALDTLIDLSAIFSDVDNPVLTLTVTANSNPDLLEATVAGNTLTLNYLPNAFGTADITVRATDAGGLYAEGTFVVTVNPVEDAPVAVKPVGALTVDAGYPNMVIDLASVIADPDGPIPTYAVLANSNPSLIGATIDGSNLTLSFPASSIGTTQITLRATDAAGLYAEDTFTVKVGPYLNSAGLVARYTFDGSTAADTAPYGIVDDSGALTGGASVVTDPTRGRVLSLDGVDDLVAIASSADIDNLAVTQRTVAFFFKANNTTNTQILYEEGGSSAGDGMSVYIRGGRLYAAIYSGPSMYVSAALANDGKWHHVAAVLDTAGVRLRGYLDGTYFGLAPYSAGLDAHPDGVGIGKVNGHAFIPIPSTNFDETSSVAFGGLIDDVRIYNRSLSAAEVAFLAGRPAVASPLADVSVDWTAGDQVIDLSGLFANPTESPLTLTVTGNSNPAAAGASINGANLTLDYTAFVSGATTITVRGTADNGYYAEDAFDVTVNPIVDATAPVVVEVTPAGAATGAILAPLDHIVLKFDDAMYSVDAGSAGNYRLAGPGADATLGTADDVAVALTASYDGAAREVTLTADGGTLACGQYRLTVYGQSGHGLRNEAGLLLDGDSNGTAGGNRVMEFAVSSPGDANLDGVVDASDYITVKLNFGVVGAGFSGGDFDGSGTVDLRDLMLLIANMDNTVVAPPAPAAAAPAVTEESPAAAAGTKKSSPADATAAMPGVVALGAPALPDKYAMAAQAAAYRANTGPIPRPMVPQPVVSVVSLRVRPLECFDALGAALPIPRIASGGAICEFPPVLTRRLQLPWLVRVT